MMPPTRSWRACTTHSLKRSALFVADRNLRAKTEGLARFKTVEFWYRRKYSLPATDPRFLAVTVDEMLADYYAHLFFDDPKAAETVEDENFDQDAVAREIGFAGDDWEDVK